MKLIPDTDLSAVKVKDGKLEDADGVKKDIQTDYADFIPNTNTHGANVDNPPDNNGGGASSRAAQVAKDYYAAIYGAAEGAKK